MHLSQLVRRFLGRIAPTSPIRNRRHGKPLARLVLEQLEDRVTPSTATYNPVTEALTANISASVQASIVVDTVEQNTLDVIANGVILPLSPASASDIKSVTVNLSGQDSLTLGSNLGLPFYLQGGIQNYAVQINGTGTGNTLAIANAAADNSITPIFNTQVVTPPTTTAAGTLVFSTGPATPTLTIGVAANAVGLITDAYRMTANIDTGTNTTNVLATTAGTSLAIDGQSATNTVTIGSNAPNLFGTLANVHGTVNVSNATGQTILNVDDSGDPVASNVLVTSGGITGLGTGGAAIDYAQAGAGIGVLNIFGGSGGNTFTVQGTPQSRVIGEPTTTIEPSAGTSTATVNIQAAAKATNLVIDGQAGTDSVVVGSNHTLAGLEGMTVAVEAASVAGMKTCTELQLLAMLQRLTAHRVGVNRMRGRKPKPLTILPSDQLELERIAHSDTSPWYQVRRARIVLGIATGQSRETLATQLGCDQTTIWRTCRRYRQLGFAELLADKRQGHSGRDLQITPLQRAQLVELACLEPIAKGLHITHWASADLARQAMAEGIVSRISPRTVRDLLNNVDLQPHRTRYWKTARLDARFKQRAEQVLWCYGNTTRLAEHGVWVVCVDEVPTFQVVERRPIRRAIPGSIEQQEFDYIRHGTLNLLFFLIVQTGHMELAFLPANDQVHYIPELERFHQQHRGWEGVYLIQDGGSSHIGAATRNYFARAEEWWKPRLTPANASWLNQAEILIHVFKHHYLNRGSWPSREACMKHIQASVTEYNELYAHPFEWTWTNHKMRQWFAKHAA